MINKNEKLIKTAMIGEIPVLVWGAPGVGKTATILSLGVRMRLPVEVVISSIRDPTDFAGLPVVVGATVNINVIKSADEIHRDVEVRLAPPTWARRLAKARHGLLFLDEISTTPPTVQATLLRVALERVVGMLGNS